MKKKVQTTALAHTNMALAHTNVALAHTNAAPQFSPIFDTESAAVRRAYSITALSRSETHNVSKN